MTDPSDFYRPLVFLHVLAFAYWLGGDFGVYVTGGFVARADLPLAERLRFLDALLRIDLLPRTGIVLLPVLGAQIAALRGAITPPPWLQLAFWLLGISWLMLVWAVFAKRGTKLGERLQRLDVGFRWLLIPVLAGIGLYLRTVIQSWVEGFRLLREGPDERAEALIAAGLGRGRRGAYLFWVVIALTAWLGIAKPF